MQLKKNSPSPRHCLDAPLRTDIPQSLKAPKSFILARGKEDPVSILGIRDGFSISIAITNNTDHPAYWLTLARGSVKKQKKASRRLWAPSLAAYFGGRVLHEEPQRRKPNESWPFSPPSTSSRLKKPNFSFPVPQRKTNAWPLVQGNSRQPYCRASISIIGRAEVLCGPQTIGRRAASSATLPATRLCSTLDPGSRFGPSSELFRHKPQALWS